MASTNPFDLLGDNENDDPSQLIAAAAIAQPLKAVQKKPQVPEKPTLAKLPTKPLPPSQAVKESRNGIGSGPVGGRSGGRGGFGRGRGGGFNREPNNNGSTFNNGSLGGYAAAEDGELGKPSERGRGSHSGSRAPYRGGRRGGFSNGEEGDTDRPARRQYERRSGTGRGNEFKREGAGRGNWGTPTDEGFIQESEELVNANENNASPEKQPTEADAAGANRENPVKEEEKEPEDKEMTLEEYEKVLEEKRKALQALKTEERKVDLDKDFESMQQLSVKRDNDEIFVKLGSDKRKENAEKEEKAKKSVSINEFLKPAEGGRYYSPGGRGRGRGDRSGFRGGYTGARMNNSEVSLPSIEDPGQFPTLGAK